MPRGSADSRQLTRRQREIASLIADGLKNQAIARRLFLSVRTVEDHVVEIRNKLGFDNRAQIASWYALQSVAAEEPRDRLASPPPPNNLPAHLTSFVGRHAERSGLQRLLRTARLVTLTGPGGCGKTRLAQQVVAEIIRSYPAGVWFVDLSLLNDPRRLAVAVATTLGAEQIKDDKPLDTILAVLRPDRSRRRRLLILDNCEHLIEGCGRLSEALLQACPELSLFCTSRQPLRVAGEVVRRLDPLALPADGVPTVKRAEESDAVRLFVDRAKLVDASFGLDEGNVEAVVRIVQRLDGLPLALELAAGHLGQISVGQLWRHIDDHFVLAGRRGAVSRQRTLEATIHWSYELLNDAERRQFRRLAVFSGHFTLESAAAVSAIGHGGVTSLSVLSALIDKSLVLAPLDNPDRYRLFGTIRRFGLARLRQSGELDEVRRRHFEHFAGFVEHAAAELRGPNQLTWLGRFAEAHDDLLAAFDYALQHVPGAALRLALSLERFWFIRGHLSEGRRRFETALGLDSRVCPERARALVAMGKLAWRQGDTKAFETCLVQSLDIARQLGDMAWIQVCLTNLGTCAITRGDVASARSLYDEGLSLAQRRDDKRGVAFLRGNLGLTAALQHEHDVAEAMLAAALAVLRDLDDREEVANALIDLGVMEMDRGRMTTARDHLVESLTILRTLGDSVHVAECLEGFACIVGAAGGLERAMTLAGAASTIRESIGAPASLLARRLIEPRIEELRARLSPVSVRRSWRAGRALPFDQAIDMALVD